MAITEPRFVQAFTRVAFRNLGPSMFDDDVGRSLPSGNSLWPDGWLRAGASVCGGRLALPACLAHDNRHVHPLPLLDTRHKPTRQGTSNNNNNNKSRQQAATTLTRSGHTAHRGGDPEFRTGMQQRKHAHWRQEAGPGEGPKRGWGSGPRTLGSTSGARASGNRGVRLTYYQVSCFLLHKPLTHE